MLQKTALHESHCAVGAKMGEFADYDMPLYYGLGVKQEHLWVREHAGLFDVSHMGQASLTGSGAQKLLEKLTPSSFEKLGVNRTKYTVLTNADGGIIDDLMVTKTAEDEFHLVINAGCKHKDLKWIEEHLTEDVVLKHYDDWALIALQGPKAEQVMKDVLGIDLSDLPYMSLWYKDHSMFVSRLGYTGEDGFEISVENKDAPALWAKILEHEEVEPIGLAARDTLRLEMGYCLYGHDIDASTTPVEADLSWVIGKDNEEFLGSGKVLHQRKKGTSHKRVGIKLKGKGIAREGSAIHNEKGSVLGKLTSGGFSPSLGLAIGQGYIPIAYAQEGTEVFVNVRGRDIQAEVAIMPFLAPKTKSMKKTK